MQRTKYELERRPSSAAAAYKAFGHDLLPLPSLADCVVEEKREDGAAAVVPMDSLMCRHRDIMCPSMEACGIDVFGALRGELQPSGFEQFHGEPEIFGPVLRD